MTLEAPVAVVTGGASGIGLAICEKLSTRGYLVHVWDRTASTDERFDGRLVDIADGEAVKALGSSYERVDVLVNAAGIAGDSVPVAQKSFAEWRRVIDVNLNGTYYTCVALHAALARATGAIVNIASNAADVTRSGRAHYAASKAAVISLTRSLAYEWAPDGIRVNAVSPGYTRTPLLEAGIASGNLDLASLERLSPMNRIATTKEIADVVVLLAGGDFSFVTGETIRVDGGTTLGPARL